MRLIDADTLLDKAFGDRKGLIHTSDVKDAPTVEAIPVRRAHWTRLPSGGGKHDLLCSNCNMGFTLNPQGFEDDFAVWFQDVVLKHFSYCPFCGAHMNRRWKDEDTGKLDG